MEKTTSKLIVLLFIIILIFSLIIGILYRKTLIDHLFPSSPKNITVQADVNKTELMIYYKWQGFKEYSTVADYVVIRYEEENIQLNYKEKEMSKEFYRSVGYLQGDFPKKSYLSTEKELVVPIERNSKEGEIIIPIKKSDDKIDNITIYYAHQLALPMDMLIGWITKIRER